MICEMARTILMHYPWTICLFGSRMRGDYRPDSNLNLCVFDPISDLERVTLLEDFKQSDYQGEVSIEIWNTLDDSFQRTISPDLLLIQKGKNYLPNAYITYPCVGIKRTAMIRNIIQNSNICVGEFTYYDDTETVYNFLKNVMYHFDFIGDQLIIGKFCQIAQGVRFIMNGACHNMDFDSTYPFYIFGNFPLPKSRGNTIVGNDVWIGCNATIMPGIHIGDGAIIGTGSLVTKNVDPYTLVAGNPARVIRNRFPDEKITALLLERWWDAPIDTIQRRFKWSM